MKRAAFCAILMLLCCVRAEAEEAAQTALAQADLSGIVEFAAEYGAEIDPNAVAEAALQGDMPEAEELYEWAKDKLAAPLLETLRMAQGLLAPLLLLSLLRCVLPEASGGAIGARFLLRMTLLLGFSEVAVRALEASADCIRAAGSLSGAAAPALTALLAAMGMSGTSALVSPAAALAGDAAERMFLNCGMPLCRFALCTAVAGSLSPAVDLSGMSKLLRKAANWSAGLATTLFTALLAMQGCVTGAVDGVAVRTAKFAVDSAAGVIGSGVSDAWDSYVSGVMIAKNAVGVSGIALLFSVALRPMLICIASMLMLDLIAALLSALGERETASAAGQISGICQMGLSLATGAVAIATVLLGAAMAAGGNFAG